ncbi:DivIVA domain-containing protein [Thermomonospora cellulosilytica]|uniref:Cell wall synthesis protein Wag31 n=1 Tax=Thermomonospora cellulosilytica TaxID=1411118 RepID=A0A7W3N405_9ACTN|nr:DivIVA domain-containing protein [Thermomonospora cellulosilytica]MBA9007092.1 DivIVA domain-containing protein [Thermomonospora cellulosilytica]
MHKRRFPVVLRGYDCAQVDALTERIERALRTGSWEITPEDVMRSRFAVVLRGYDQRAVDEFLYESIAELRARMAPPPPRRPPERPRVEPARVIGWIEGTRFSSRSGEHAGYDARDVDAFLDRVIAGLRGQGPRVDAAEVRAASFRTVRLGLGYDRREVDHFLSRLADALESAAY